MSRKKSESDGGGIGLVIFIGIIYFCWDYLVKIWNFLSENWLWILVAIVGLVFSVLFLSARADEKSQQRRYQYLINKYHDDSVVRGIMNEQVWRGQTDEQLLDSWGNPEDKDIKVLKSKRTEIWKYGKINSRSYRQKVTLENGIVVGYEV